MKTTENTSTLTYSHDEIQEILQIAIARQSLSQNDQESMTQTQLWEIATELGINHDTIINVEKDWHEKQLIQQKRNEFNAYRREEFQYKIIRFSIINLFLMAINLLGAHQLSWSLYVALMWGLFLALNAWQTFETKGEKYEKAFLNWERKSQFKEYLLNIWGEIQQFIQSLKNQD